MFKTANVGTADRIVRIVLGIALFVLPLVMETAIWATPLARWVTIAVGVVLIATALVRFCPLYRLVGTNTCRT